MAVLGYARVSTDGQTLASQDAALIAAGCAKVYSEKISGARSDRPQLAKLLKMLRESDTVV
jgi:DNA invertase Pin-like site-specific DNA recombinase